MLSITIPVYDEEESVGPLITAVADAMRGWREDWELVFVDDGSRDGTVAAIHAAIAQEPRVRVLRLARNYGQSAAMQAGFDAARGDLIVTMDGDHQNDPRDIPQLVEKLEEGYDLVAGYRERRQDRFITRKLPSWFGNALVRKATGVAIRDTGCTLKVFRRELLDQLRLYSDLHRFIPALAVSLAGARIAELPVQHHPRRFGQSKYGMTRVAKVLADLLTLVMLRRFRERPLRMFSAAGLISLSLAALMSVLALLAAWGVFDSGSVVVLAAVAVCWLALGGFLLMAGFIAESFLFTEGEASRTDRVFLRSVHA